MTYERLHSFSHAFTIKRCHTPTSSMLIRIKLNILSFCQEVEGNTEMNVNMYVLQYTLPNVPDLASPDPIWGILTDQNFLGHVVGYVPRTH